MFNKSSIMLFCSLLGTPFISYSQPNAEIEDPYPGEILEICTDQEVALEISNSTDSLMVDWGDGSPLEYYDSNPGVVDPHTYNIVGTFTVLLVAFESPFQNDTAFLQVKVSGNDALDFTHDYVVDTCLIEGGVSVNFTDQSILVNPTSDYVINYGDGFGQTGVLNSTHTYLHPGTYTVTINTPCTSPYSETIVILEGPSLIDNISIESECPCNEIVLKANGTGDIIEWNFGDGNILNSSSTQESHTYRDPGFYLASVTTKDAATGCIGKAYKNLLICGGDTAYYSHSNDEWHFSGYRPWGEPGNRIRFQDPYIAYPIGDTNTAISAYEGGAAICHPETGDLLFYSDGLSIYSSNNLLMENGDSLNGHISSTQSVLILPYPESINKYLVITSNGGTSAHLGYFYSIVNMDTLGGLGAVTQKNIPLFIGPCTEVRSIGNQIAHESITGTLKQRAYCSNKEEYWIIIPTCVGNYSAYPVTDQGIGSPVVSSSSSQHYNGAGQSTISLDGTKYAVIEGIDGQFPNGIKIFDFNFETGELSNEQYIIHRLSSNLYERFYSLSFSPDGSKLYASSGTSNKIYQFDLATQDISGSIVEFVIGVGTFNRAMYLGPDNRLYISDINDALNVFNFPNLKGTAADLELSKVFFPGGKAYLGMQNIVNLQLLKKLDTIALQINSTPINCKTVLFSIDTISNTFISPCSFKSSEDTVIYSWNFGDGSNSNGKEVEHTFSSSGTYNIELIIDNLLCPPDTISDSVTVDLNFINKSVDTTICIGNSIFLEGFNRDSSGIYIDTIFTNTGCDTILQTNLEVTNNQLCSDTSSQPHIMDDEYTVFVPNTFTPDGDGLNEIFSPHIVGIQINKGVYFRIYNRWGEVIFKSEDGLKGWDGTINNKLAQKGVYIWTLEFIDNRGKNRFMNGKVILIK